jgi:hypothetical protein
MRTADSAVSTLVIDPVTPSDIGTYTCSTGNLVATSQRSFTLLQILGIVSYGPLIFSLHESNFRFVKGRGGREVREEGKGREEGGGRERGR